QGRALDLLTAARTREAFHLERESDRLRDRYGRNLFGQSCLLARRLVEAGIPLVLIQSIGTAVAPKPFGVSWDMHLELFQPLKNEICPVQDPGCSTLLQDLAERGLL